MCLMCWCWLAKAHLHLLIQQLSIAWYWWQITCSTKHLTLHSGSQQLQDGCAPTGWKLRLLAPSPATAVRSPEDAPHYLNIMLKVHHGLLICLLTLQALRHMRVD